MNLKLKSVHKHYFFQLTYSIMLPLQQFGIFLCVCPSLEYTIPGQIMCQSLQRRFVTCFNPFTRR